MQYKHICVLIPIWTKSDPLNRCKPSNKNIFIDRFKAVLEMMCRVQEWYFILFELFPFEFYASQKLCPLYNLETRETLYKYQSAWDDVQEW